MNFQSRFLRVEGTDNPKSINWLSVDSLGKNKLDKNLLKESTHSHRWTFKFKEQEILLSYIESEEPRSPLELIFEPKICHVTPLGWMPEPFKVELPALLHLPDYGTLKITSQSNQTVGFEAKRGAQNFVKITLPPAEYRFESICIYPQTSGIERDTRFDGFRRNWLNIFQMQSCFGVLANNAASDPVSFAVYLYVDIARFTPPLIPGFLSAWDLIRQTLDRYISGFLGYGQTGYKPFDGPPVENTQDFLDAKPSLVIAAHGYVTGSGDYQWLNRGYPVLKTWAEAMLAEDRDGDGLLEYYLSGNSGSYEQTRECPKIRPSNWWDTIGFGHKDAYANALTYRAFLGMAELARAMHQKEDANRYELQAEKLRGNYFKAFYNPATGVLAGWQSADGKLHDYYFTFVNGIAITYGLVPEREANQIIDRMQAKFCEVGYKRFDLGLPGNLIPVRKEDYVHLDRSAGGPELDDGSDAFQIYENGGATACWAYFYIQALYSLGRCDEANAILFPMLESYEKGEFQGVGPNGKTKDWRAWDGTCRGYEGLLVDTYYTLLAVITGHLK